MAGKTPFVLGSQEIPFIRTYPNGETRLATLNLGNPEYRAAANKFIAHGGRYLIRINEHLKVDVIAVIARDGNSKDAQAVCMMENADNDASLIDDCRKVVLESIKCLDTVQ